MDSYFGMLLSLTIGYFMGIISMTLGACLISKAMKSRGLFPELLEPKGDAFNIETPDSIALFPDDEVNEAEEHILEKTNKFLEKFSAVPEAKTDGRI